MKRMLSILLVLLLLLGLCACVSDAQGNQTDANGETVLFNPNSPDTFGESGQQVGEFEYVLAVHVTIPAAFTLYLDDDMNIVSVEAGDGDAEAILSRVEVPGLTYDEGMELVLKTALGQGILAAQGNVKFTVAAEAISMELMETLFAPVKQFEKENGMFVFIDWDVIPVEEPDYEANYLYGLQKIKGEEQTIYMDKSEWRHPTAGKQIVYSYYSEFPNPMVYEYTPILVGGTLDTIRIKMLYFNEDGSTSVTYFEDGLSVKTVGINNGKLEIFEYENGEFTLNGQLAVDIRKNEDGSYSFTEFAGLNEQEGYYIVAKSIGCWEDGTQAVYTYHSNGKVATSETIGSDGSFSQSTYDENGNEIHTYLINKSPDGTYSEAEFENSQPVYQKTINPDGTYMEGYCENGNWTWTEGVIEPTAPES